MAPLVETVAHAVEVVGEQAAALVDVGNRTVDGLRLVLEEGRETAEAEAKRFRAECAAAEVETVGRLSGAIADASARAFDGRVHAIDRRTAALVTLGMVGALVVGVAGGWWSGVATTRAAIAETEVGLRAAFREGPEAARLWLDLMAWNDPRLALERCRDGGQLGEERGRRTCRLLMWVSAPPTIPTP